MQRLTDKRAVAILNFINKSRVDRRTNIYWLAHHSEMGKRLLRLVREAKPVGVNELTKAVVEGKLFRFVRQVRGKLDACNPTPFLGFN